jgi:two-component system chemotaxis response regulator CheB
MDGLTCLTYIMSEWPTPVIILSSFTHEESNDVVKALEWGAIDVVVKPSSVISKEMNDLQDELLQKIRLAAIATTVRLPAISFSRKKELHKSMDASTNKVIAIGASTGGPMALSLILSNLPEDINAGILVIQHMPKFFIKAFADRLNQHCKLYVKEAEDGEYILADKVLVAPAGYEMKIVRKKGKNDEMIELKKEEKKLHHLSPSIDKTFYSVANVFGKNAIGVILTGMGKDGTEGCRKIKEHGGTTLAEDESTCVVYGMPASAISAGVIDQVVTLDKIPQVLLRTLRRINGK